MAKNYNGKMLAFPIPGSTKHFGMTKRELMATMILAGMHGEGFISHCDMAESACNRADALL
jgi:hypothetical protein